MGGSLDNASAGIREGKKLVFDSWQLAFDSWTIVSIFLNTGISEPAGLSCDWYYASHLILFIGLAGPRANWSQVSGTYTLFYEHYFLLFCPQLYFVCLRCVPSFEIYVWVWIDLSLVLTTHYSLESAQFGWETGFVCWYSSLKA